MSIAERREPARYPAAKAFYSSRRWTNLSKLIRQQEPICRICRIKPSTNTDHIDGSWENNTRENLRALCTTCEKARTGSQHRRKRGG